MLQKRFRLKSPRLFQQTLDRQVGRRVCANRFFAVYGLLHTQPQPEGTQPRFGLIVSKKIDKRATRRNRIKRRLREIIRQTLLVRATIPLAPYRAIVLIVRDGAAEASYDQLRTSLLACFL